MYSDINISFIGLSTDIFKFFLSNFIMATAIVAPPEILSFENEISEAKREIETRFRELINRLRERERELVIELEQILDTYKRERDKHKQSQTELEAGLKFANENFQSNDLNEFTESIIKKLTEKSEKFKSEFDCKRVSVEFDETVLRLAGTIGRVTVAGSTRLASRLPVVEYEGRVSPVLIIGGTLGGEEGQFSFPSGVSVHYLTGNIFVVDELNHRVQVFDKDGKYLYKFGDRDGAGKMKQPVCIDFYENTVFVSQYTGGCLLVYDLDGTFIQQIGTPGNGEGQFNNPYGITINQSNGELFVCDWRNNRVQIFSKDFLFKSQFGQGILKYPTDIKLTSEFIYVLSSTKPFLYSFRHDLTQIQSPVLTSISKHLKDPCSFCIDGAGNFIISDHIQNAVIIFNHQGDVVHRITDGVQLPMGVTLDARGRIIIVGFNHLLLIFLH